MSRNSLNDFSAAQLDTLREAHMRAGRENDPIFSAPATLWWLALAALLVPPM